MRERNLQAAEMWEAKVDSRMPRSGRRVIEVEVEVEANHGGSAWVAGVRTAPEAR